MAVRYWRMCITGGVCVCVSACESFPNSYPVKLTRLIREHTHTRARAHTHTHTHTPQDKATRDACPWPVTAQYLLLISATSGQTDRQDAVLYIARSAAPSSGHI